MGLVGLVEVLVEMVVDEVVVIVEVEIEVEVEEVKVVVLKLLVEVVERSQGPASPREEVS